MGESQNIIKSSPPPTQAVTLNRVGSITGHVNTAFGVSTLKPEFQTGQNRNGEYHGKSNIKDEFSF